jgi:16S rRNA (cytidine1402-2'-O)-methyltransferase
MISDPGYRLIEAALGNQLTVTPIPGVSAATTALSVAGLPTDSFTFVGFLSKKKARRQRQINELASVPRTLIFYESPRRIAALLTEITNIMGNRRGVLAREMTKLHEEFIRGLLSEISDRLADRKDIRGECTLLVAGNDSDTGPSWPEVKQEIEAAVAAGQKSLSAIARDIASTAGIAKNRIYAEALKISKELDSG